MFTKTTSVLFQNQQAKQHFKMPKATSSKRGNIFITIHYLNKRYSIF